LLTRHRAVVEKCALCSQFTWVLQVTVTELQHLFLLVSDSYV
jgi:hypothetical protein